MYYVNKIVGWILSPVGILFIGFALACLIGRGDAPLRRRISRWIAVLTLAFVWILGCGVTTRFIGVPLEGEEAPLIDTLEAGGYDAVVLLGGGMGFHKKCGRAEMFGSADRVWEAARLWKAHHIEGDDMKMTLSGGDVAGSTIPLLRDLGVPEEACLFFDEARNTEEEATLIAKAGIRRILLVTSAWHMPRARMLFERKGFDVTCRPCDYEMHYVAENDLEFSDFIPCVDALCRNTWALKEWVARFGYRALRR